MDSDCSVLVMGLLSAVIHIYGIAVEVAVVTKKRRTLRTGLNGADGNRLVSDLNTAYL